MTNLKIGLLVAAGIGFSAAAQAGQITVSGSGFISSADVSATSAAGATTSPFPLADFGQAGTNGLVSSNSVNFQGGQITFTPNSQSPNAGVYDGNTANVAVSPFTGGSNPANLTPRNYLVAQPGDPVTISYNLPQSAFSLLWGTVDTYNSLNLDLFFGSTELGMLTVTGSQVATAVGGGFQANGTTPAFVTVSDFDFGFFPSAFDRVVATSTKSAFEFDPSLKVPEPASLAILGAGLLGLGIARRRKASHGA